MSRRPGSRARTARRSPARPTPNSSPAASSRVRNWPGSPSPSTPTAQTLRAYFQAHPEDLAGYAAKNPRGIFFTVTSGGPYGSLGQLVTTDVTVATNKQIFPPAGPMLVQTTVIGASGRAEPYAALRLDQDTGGAMRAPGRADLYMGVGDSAGQRAGGQWHEGRMWYLILK